MDISVVIPAYNEDVVIVATVHSVLQYLKKHFNTFEIIVVDDGSHDRTADEVRKISAVKLISLPKNRGKGFAVKTGAQASTGDLILFMDADHSTNISELSHFSEEIRDHDIVIGSRALNRSRIEVSQSVIKKMAGRLGNRLIKTILGLPFQDTQCGFKLFKSKTKEVFDKQTIERWGFDFEILFIAHRMRFSVYESPVIWINNFNSKVSAGSYLATFAQLLTVRMNALRRKY